MLIQKLLRTQRQGLLTTPSFTIPADARKGEILIVADILTGDYENLANFIYADLYQEDSSVRNGWRLRASNRPNGWKGGRLDHPVDGRNPPPILFALSLTPSELGKNFRIDVEMPTSFSVGFDIHQVET